MAITNRIRYIFFTGLLAISLISGSCHAQSRGSGGEVLYNGIRLPAIWPPKTQDPKSAEPMAVPYLDNPPEIIPINVGRQLFVDDFLIEHTNLERVFHKAEKYEGNPVFKAETKHEINPSESPEPGQQYVTYLGHGGVFYDPASMEFKMFYTAGWRGGLALATSKDLITWNRPDLGIVDQNLLLPPGWLWAGGDNSVWLDLNAGKPNERLKFLVERGSNRTPTLNQRHTLHTSSDGKIWSQGVPVTTKAEDYCSFFYNPFRKTWVYSIKQPGRGRARHYSENPDFIKGADWANSVFWVNADRLDEPDPEVGDPAQLYSLNAVAYESIMLGQFYIHLGPKNEICDQGKFPKITELKMGFSRDGFHWSRPDRRPFINATRKEGSWDRAYLHGTTGVCMVIGDKIWFPYCAYSGIAPNGHRGMYTGASIGMATLRRDGFASMEAGNKTGTLTTRKVTFDGTRLFVNTDCSEGELRVEIADENGKVIPKFSFKNAIPVKLDKTIEMVSWKSGNDLSELKGKPVKFRFHLTNGKLFSFWVSPDEDGASNGYVGTGSPGFEGVIDTKGIKAY